MTDEIESYGAFQSELSELLQRAEKSGLDNAMLAGILLDYRDHLKMTGDTPEVPAGIKR
ncbi:hypothetical protein [Haloferax sulfurifontis]|uniref:hypothetical protein n=1 Tax=Haloferax sulfurifontis TaxID=255616 RepID=UPI00137630AB|nr:hypothetical protein [Haloferax sulfurifontis]